MCEKASVSVSFSVFVYVCSCTFVCMCHLRQRGLPLSLSALINVPSCKTFSRIWNNFTWWCKRLKIAPGECLASSPDTLSLSECVNVCLLYTCSFLSVYFSGTAIAKRLILLQEMCVCVSKILWKRAGCITACNDVLATQVFAYTSMHVHTHLCTEASVQTRENLKKEAKRQNREKRHRGMKNIQNSSNGLLTG